MWRVIIIAVLVVFSNARSLEVNSTLSEKDKEVTVPFVASETQTPIPIETTATESNQLIGESTKPTTEADPTSTTVLVELEEETEPSKKRRVVTYDQRQEGMYNIRAELDNFMIVLIPPIEFEGLNVLDLLSKSTKRTKSAHKKYLPGSNYRQNFKSNLNSNNFNLIARHNKLSQQAPHVIVEEHPTAHITEYIEGRTPYSVDISNTNSDPEQLQQQPHTNQVDVLPPSFPLPYQHLIKPFHLEAEPTVIQALPPVSTPNNGQFVDSNGNIFRMTRAVQDGSLFGVLSLDSNKIQPRKSSATNEKFVLDKFGRSDDLPLTGDDLQDSANNYVYPPLNPPTNAQQPIWDYQERAIQFDYPSYSEKDPIKSTEVQFKLLGATEDCGPDRKRDSYGICRFAAGY